MAEGILAQKKGETILVATGSMTNMALLMSLFPEVIEWLKAVVIMGGAISVGNVTPVAEFNIWVSISYHISDHRQIPKPDKSSFPSPN